MLGKTANGLYWMYRYMERAENTAHLIETGQRIALTRLNQSDDEWASVLQSADALPAFKGVYDTVSKASAIDWLLRDPDNSSSVQACIAAARQNARLVRTAITGDVWEAVNAAHMETGALLFDEVSERDLPKILRRIRQHAAMVRGVTLGTMMRNEIYDFARLGTFLERADNTARILDVKYYVLLPSSGGVGSSIDNVQWETILRSLSARGGFRMEYGAGGGPKEIANFLILDKRMPRSLAFCASKLCDNLRYLCKGQKIRPPSMGKIDDLERNYLSHSIDEVFAFGLHEYLQKVQSELAEASRQIEIDFRFYE